MAELLEEWDAVAGDHVLQLLPFWSRPRADHGLWQQRLRQQHDGVAEVLLAALVKESEGRGVENGEILLIAPMIPYLQDVLRNGDQVRAILLNLSRGLCNWTKPIESMSKGCPLSITWLVGQSKIEEVLQAQDGLHRVDLC